MLDRGGVRKYTNFIKGEKAMKKISKIFVSVALVLVLMILVLSGCDFFGGDTKAISEIQIVG